MQYGMQCRVIANHAPPLMVLPVGCMVEGCPVPPYPLTLRVLTELHQR